MDLQHTDAQALLRGARTVPNDIAIIGSGRRLRDAGLDAISDESDVPRWITGGARVKGPFAITRMGPDLCRGGGI